MRYVGVLLNSSVDGLDGRYGPQGDPDYPGLGRNVQDPPEPPDQDFDEDLGD